MADLEHSGRPAGALAPAPPEARLRAARLALWAVAALLALRRTAVTLTAPGGQRLTDPATWLGPHGVPRVHGSLYDSTGFTGTPLAGLVLGALTRSAQAAPGWGGALGTLLPVAALGLAAARALPPPVTRRTARLAAPVALCLLMLSLPVRDARWPGPAGAVPVLLVVLGCLTVRGQRTGGLCVGLAAALQPAVLLFVPLLWRTGRRRAALTAVGTFAAGTALAGAALPHDSAAYWVHRPAGAGLGGRAHGAGDQSLHGALLRLGLSGPPQTLLFVLLGAAVTVAALRRAVRYAHDGQPLLAVAVTGCAAVAVCPATGRHQLLWVLLAVAGRAGTRASDRYVWPVAAVLVTTLPARMLVPDTPVLHPLRDDLGLLAALAAAVAVPFLPRTAPSYRSPVPVPCANPVPARFRRLPPPFPRRALCRPNLLLELLLLRATYAVYSSVRLAARGGRETAEAHGRQILAVERALSLDVEHWVNRTVVGLPRLDGLLSFYYASFHFAVPLTLLAVLYARRPVDYRWARTSLGFATVLGLAGFWLYPLAPPRLMPGFGFVDTVHGPQNPARPGYGAMTAVTNQYAAMPSLHFGWSLWCAIVIVAVAPWWWLKALGVLHPLFTASAIVATANHWVLDAAGGAAVAGAGFALTRLLSGPRAIAAPEREGGRRTAPAVH